MLLSDGIPGRMDDSSIITRWHQLAVRSHNDPGRVDPCLGRLPPTHRQASHSYGQVKHQRLTPTNLGLIDYLLCDVDLIELEGPTASGVSSFACARWTLSRSTRRAWISATPPKRPPLPPAPPKRASFRVNPKKSCSTVSYPSLPTPALNLLWIYSKFVLKLLYNCPEFTLNLLWICSKFALNLL